MAASAPIVSRREISNSARKALRSGGRKGALGFDVQAIAVNAGDPNSLADGRRAAARAPFAVADADAAAMLVDGGDDRHDLSDQPPRAVVEQRIGAAVDAGLRKSAGRSSTASSA